MREFWDLLRAVFGRQRGDILIFDLAGKEKCTNCLGPSGFANETYQLCLAEVKENNLPKGVHLPTKALVAYLLLSVVLGCGGAFALILELSVSNLRANGRNILQFTDTSGRQIVRIESVINSSHYAYCSADEIAMMNGLLANAPFLTDIAHLKNHAIGCSARFGKFPAPLTLPTAPDKVTDDGSEIYDLNPVPFGTTTGSGRVVKDSAVVIDNRVFFDPPPLQIRYSDYTFPKRSLHVFKIFGEDVPLKREELLAQRYIIRDGSVYVPVCYPNLSYCVVSSMSFKSALVDHPWTIFGVTVFGVVTGLSWVLIVVVSNGRQQTLDSQLRQAIRSKQLYLAYQPIVELPSGRIVGAEALLRWKNTVGDQVPPDVFIEVAERKGMMSDITAFVIDSVLQDLGCVMRDNPTLKININISPSDLNSDALLLKLESSLKHYGVEPSSVAIELTERHLEDRHKAGDTITLLRDRGHAIYLDDFGTGYSSLSYLNEFNIDAIKLDRSFTSTVGTDSLIASIVPQILIMARVLSLGVIVEGIETKEQAEYFGCGEAMTLAQGYYFGEPVSRDAFLEQIRRS